MTIYNQFDVVVSNFPFSDGINSKPRPALVLSSKEYNQQYGQTILCMITTAKNIQWNDDIQIKHLDITGLPVKSFIRPKIGTLENDLLRKSIGRISGEDVKALKKKFSKIIF